MKEVMKVSALVVAVGSAFTWGVNVWTDWGWVTRHEYQADGAVYVTQREYDRHVVAQERHNAEQQAIQSEILAHVKIVPQLESLYRTRCMGGYVLQSLIVDLERQYFELTEEVYEEPSCERLLGDG